MTESHQHSLNKILSQSTRFNEIVNKVEQLSKLNRLLHEKLEPKLAKFCRVANIRDDRLILVTHSPDSGHLLRFAENELISKLSFEPEWNHIKSIKTIVRPILKDTNPLSKPMARNLPKLSAETQENIAIHALNISYPPLRQALQRLIKSQF